jgi:hypothetical protein
MQRLEEREEGICRGRRSQRVTSLFLGMANSFNKKDGSVELNTRGRGMSRLWISGGTLLLSVVPYHLQVSKSSKLFFSLQCFFIYLFLYIIILFEGIFNVSRILTIFFF